MRISNSTGRAHGTRCRARNVAVAVALFGTASLWAADAPTNGNTKAEPIWSAETNVFTNSLGMRFTTVPATKVRFSIWETRVSDYRAFCEATDRAHNQPEFKQDPSHPAVNVNWDDAQAFCRWLTGKERNDGRLGPLQKYRLPTDAEWNIAVGLGSEKGSTPEQRMKTLTIWPWGYYWPPQASDGNYGPALKVDPFAATAPVGSFKPNALGIYDLGGNVWEWCDDWYSEAQVTRVLRGGSFNDALPGYLLAAYRFSATMNLSNEDIGFRIILATE